MNVGNQGQQPSRPGQGLSGQQGGFYGWQYDQSNAAPNAAPPSPPYSPQPTPLPQGYTPQQPSYPPPMPSQPGYPQQPGYPRQMPPVQRKPQEPAPDIFQDTVYDMGSTLGYGQATTEFQFFETPQPSQPIAQLRQERLQQLREERMRRQQRRMQGDVTTIAPWWQKKSPSGLPPTLRPNAPGVTGMPPQVAPPPGMQPAQQPPSMESTARGFRGVIGEQVERISEKLKAARVPSQDTGMIQRVNVRRATMLLTFAFVASRALGIIRTSMFGAVFATSNVSDAYVQAFLVPDLIFNIVSGGALSSAFIPVFTKYMIGDKDEKTAWHIASTALNLVTVVMMVLAGLAILFAPVLVPLYNPGIKDAQQLALITDLTRIMLLQAIILGSGVIVTAVLNAKQDFRIPAIGTVLYNVGLIAGLLPGLIISFAGHRSDANDLVAIHWASWGVVLGALLQVGVQVYGLKKVGMQYSLTAFSWRHPGVIQIVRQMLPRMANSIMLYSSIFVDRGLIQMLMGDAKDGAEGLITQNYQAWQLVLLPLGIFGVAVSTAAFPTLAENVAKGRLDRVRNTISETLRSTLFLSIPSGIGLMVLGLPVIQVLLQHGRYSLSMAQATAVPLTFFAFGLAGHAAIEILTRAFYAMRDSKTPVIISILQFIFKIALSIVLMTVAVIGGTSWGMAAIASATSIAALLEAFVLFWLLHQRLGALPLKEIGSFILRTLIASAVMGVALFFIQFIINFLLTIVGKVPFLRWMDTMATPALGLPGTIMAAIKLGVMIFLGLIVYVRMARLLGIQELGPLKKVLDRLRLSWI
uniref:Probable lipid II flippase MurJ n=1 Tax=Thermosporothrix sp. COM3 TaxID=2490863 RepID=A0A455SQM6_9CHLR|nr:hypothetical protein KTC_32360 [Thermosporothrix sp. COM3]